jgi:hypothetical protein
MRIAVLVYGEFREFDTLIKHWNFLNEINHDMYFVTWDYSIQIHNHLGIKRERYITDELVKSTVPNAEYQILKESDYFEDTTYPNRNKAHRVMVHWKKCLDMVKKSGKEYDLIMLTRTDNYTEYYITEEKLQSINRIDAIYGLTNIHLSSPHSLFVQDLFFLGDYKIMSNLIETLPNDLYSMHNSLSEHIMKLGYYVEKIIDVNITTFRPNCLNMSEQINFPSVCRKHIEWHTTEKL